MTTPTTTTTTATTTAAAATVQTDAVVVGGGIAGLAAAQLLRRAGVKVVVLDSQRLGGRARTDERGACRSTAALARPYLAGEGFKVPTR